MKRRIADAFPYYDTNALDSARFLYGNDSDEVEFYEGDKTILDYLEEDDFTDFDASLEQVPEGQRNSTMSHIAGKIIKRYGNTEDAYQIFLKKAELCNPPLPESELKVIWRSASKFGNKVSNQEGYIPPEQYNSDCRLKPEDFSDVGQATVLATEYKDIIRYSPSIDYMVYNGSFWEESKPKSQGVSQDLTERQLAEAETEMKKTMDELVKMANEKDTEIRQQEKEIEDKVNKKDSEKREFNWKLVGGISFALMTVAGISAGVLGGKFDLKFPKKS